MKIIVKEEFTDKFDHVTRYKVGKELDFDEDRCQDLIKRGLAKLADKPVKEEKPKRNNKKK